MQMIQCTLLSQLDNHAPFKEMSRTEKKSQINHG